MIRYKSAILLGLSFSVCTTVAHAAASMQRDTTSAPVETQKPNNNYKPAFKGQTRIGGVKTKTPIVVSVINSSLKNPWGIHVLPDGRFLVTEKAGSMRILKASGGFDKQITGFANNQVLT